MERYTVHHEYLMPYEHGNVVLSADAQATVEALQRERDAIKRSVGLDCGDQSCLYAMNHGGMRTNGGCRCNPKRMKEDLQRAQAALDAELEKVKAIEKVLDIDSGKTTVEKVVDLKRSFAQVWESYQDAANEMFEAQAHLTQLQALVRDFIEAWDHDGEPNAVAYEGVVARARATLDGTTPAPMGSNILEEDIGKSMMRRKGGAGE